MPVYRIISDIHLGDDASLVRSPEVLRPLFAGVQSLIFNGDSVETRPGPRAVVRRAVAEKFMAFCRQEAPAPVFITGNHDPDISAQHHLDLAGGEILVTHGDVLYPEIVPWGLDSSRLATLFRDDLVRLTAAGQDQLMARLAACKAASAQVPIAHDYTARNAATRLASLCGKMAHPLRLFRMLRAWWQMADRAASLAGHFRPAARFVILGHTHLPGIWTRGGLTVINTGSFVPLLGHSLVDIETDAVVVRGVERKHDGYHPGKVKARFALSRPLNAEALATAAGLRS